MTTCSMSNNSHKKTHQKLASSTVNKKLLTNVFLLFWEAESEEMFVYASEFVQFPIHFTITCILYMLVNCTLFDLKQTQEQFHCSKYSSFVARLKVSLKS